MTVAGTSVGLEVSPANAIDANRRETNNTGKFRRSNFPDSLIIHPTSDSSIIAQLAPEDGSTCLVPEWPERRELIQEVTNFALPPGCRLIPHSSLLRKDSDTTVAALRGARSTCLQGYKSVVVGGIDSNAVRIGIGRNVFQPNISPGIDDAHNRAVGHIASGQIVAVVARVIPDFIDAPDVSGGGVDYSTAAAIDHVIVGRKSFAVVVGAANKEVVARTLDDTGRHAVR